MGDRRPGAAAAAAPAEAAHPAAICYVDHVTKHVRAGRVSRQVKDNQLELVFEGGKIIIPPLIHERPAVWELINALPAEVRDDGVPRANRAPAAGEASNRAGEDLMAFLNSPDGPHGRGE